MANSQEPVHHAQPLPADEQARGVGNRERPTVGREPSGEDPATRQQTRREPFENVETTLDKIADNPQIEGT